MANTTTQAAIFVTDYESYNNGEQFKLGHWVQLSEYSSAAELMQYINNHFASNGINDFELMITDFEGFNESLYSESMNEQDFEKVYKSLQYDFENMDDYELLGLWSEYCDDMNMMDDYIYIFDEDFFNTYFEGKPMEAARAATFGSLNWMHNFIKFDGYSNLESIDSIYDEIDDKALLEWVIANK